LNSEPEVLPPLDPTSKENEPEKEHIKEITITIDKYSWEIFLKKIKNILKTCFILSEDLTMSKKLKKNNPLKSIMSGEAEEYQTIMSSLFRIVITMFTLTQLTNPLRKIKKKKRKENTCSRYHHQN